MLCDVLVAIVDRDQLNAILPAVHQHALGHVARVLDAGRGEVTSQLRRAGVPVEQAPAIVVGAPLMLMISAAARCPAAARLLMRAGVDRVWIVARNGSWSEIDDSVILVAPDATPPREQPLHIAVPGIRDRAAPSRTGTFLTDTPGAGTDASDGLSQ